MLLAGAIVACSSNGEDGACVGQEVGEVLIRESIDVRLPEGGTASIGATNLDEDPPTVTIHLGGATEADRSPPSI